MNIIKNQTRKQVVENFDAQNAPIFKRFGATLVDLILLFVLYAILGLASRPILTSVSNFETLNTQLTAELKKSNLVKLDQELAEDYSNIDEVEIVPLEGVYRVEVENYAKATYEFYTDYMYRNNYVDVATYTEEWYLVNVLKINETSSFFERVVPVDEVALILYSSTTTPASSSQEVVYDDFLPASVKYKSTTTPEQIAAFNIGIYSGAIGKFNENEFSKQISQLLLIESSMLFVVGGSLIYLLIPLLLKNGQTLGKKLLKLSVVDRYGYRIGALTTLIRFFAFLILYILSLEINMLIALVLIFVSLTMTVFSKKLRSIHDYIASTRVIDHGKSVIYDDYDDFLRNHPVDKDVIEINE